MNFSQSIYKVVFTSVRFGVLFGLLSLISCTEEISPEDANVQRDKDIVPKLVVDGRVTTDTTTHWVRLSLTADLFSTQKVPAVLDAVVTIDDGYEEIELEPYDQVPGVYVTPADYYGVPGRTYSLLVRNVDADGDGEMEEYRAQSELKRVNPVDSVDVGYNKHWGGWTVLLYASEPGETEDFYGFSTSINGKVATNAYSKWGITDDRLFNGSTIRLPVAVVFLPEEDHVVKDGDIVELEMYGITEDFFTFLWGVQREAGFKNPMFSAPPANPKSNVSNGALGFFAAYSVARNHAVVDASKFKK